MKWQSAECHSTQNIHCNTQYPEHTLQHTVPRTNTFENVHHVQMLEDVEFASTLMLKYRASLREGRALLQKYRALWRNVYLVQTLRHIEFARRHSCLGCESRALLREYRALWRKYTAL